MYFSQAKSLILLVILFFLTLFAQAVVAPIVFSEAIIFGDKRFALFDFWTLQHVFSGVIAGSLILFWKHLTFREYVTSILLLAFIWEFLELGMEHGLAGRVVSEWKFGYEFILNRIATDPISVLIGGILQWRFRTFVYFALPMALIWLFANIASPHSMSIQNMILK